MRLGAGIGILGLLLTMAIVFYLMFGRGGPGGASYMGTVAQQNRELKREANQLGGRDASGQRMSESLTLEAWPETGSLKGAKVTAVDAQGPAAAHFGLQVDDVITQVGSQEVGGFVIASVESTAEFLEDAYARGQSIEVTRDGETLTLPATGTAAPSPAGGMGGVTLPGGQSLPALGR